MRDDAPRERRLPLPRLRERPAPQRRPQEARLQRVPNPLAVERARNHDVLWGLHPAARGRQQVTIEVRRKGKKKFSKLRT